MYYFLTKTLKQVLSIITKYILPCVEMYFDLFQVLPNSIQILMAVVNFQTKLKKPRRGVCSNWIASLRPSESKFCPGFSKSCGID